MGYSGNLVARLGGNGEELLERNLSDGFDFMLGGCGGHRDATAWAGCRFACAARHRGTVVSGGRKVRRVALESGSRTREDAGL